MTLKWWEEIWIFLLSHQKACFSVWCKGTDWMYMQPKLPWLFPDVAERLHRRRGSSRVRKCLFPHLPKGSTRATFPFVSSALLCTCQGLVHISEGFVCLQDGFLYSCLGLQEALEDLICLRTQQGAKTCQAAKDVVSCWGNYCSVNLQIGPFNFSILCRVPKWLQTPELCAILQTPTLHCVQLLYLHIVFLPTNAHLLFLYYDFIYGYFNL